MSDREGGSASIWVLACALAILAAGYLVEVRTAAVLLRHRAESAADLAALAAAGALGTAADPCGRARQIASADGASVTACSLVAVSGVRSGVITVRVASSASLPIIGSVTTTASARAGRG